MLSAPDAGLARRDPVLPGLGMLLDPAAFAAALRRAVPGAEIGAADITYLRYKPATNCLVAYRVEVDGEPVDIYAKAHQPAALDKLRKAEERTVVPGPLGAGRIVLPDSRITVSAFPNDDKLDQLTRLGEPEARFRLLRKLLPGRPGLWESEVRTLRYKPERRYVAKLYTGDGSHAALKCYTPQGYRTAAHSAAVFASGGPLRVAQRLGRLKHHHMLAFEWLPGRMLSDVLRDSSLEHAAVINLGTALAELHAQEPEGLDHLTRDSEAAALFSAAAAVGAVAPHLAKRAHDVARRLAARLESEPTAARPIHGDFYAEQVLLAGGTISVLDLDRAARGDPAADLGTFIAHLERDALSGTLAPERVTSIADSLRHGYRTIAHGPSRARIQTYAAAGLLRLAPEPFRYHEPDWPERTEAIVERVESLLAEEFKVQSAKRKVLGARDSGLGVELRALAPFGRAGFVPTSDFRPPRSAVSVTDPYGIAADPAMPFLARAIDPDEVRRHLIRRLIHDTDDGWEHAHLRAIRVVRHKPARRCLIEYDLAIEHHAAPAEFVTLVGKARAKGTDHRSFHLLNLLWRDGFGTDSTDGISVPEPVALVPEFQMWLQRKVPGTPATQLLAEPEGPALARHIAEAAHKLHRAGVPARRHTIEDELRILHERLGMLARAQPRWARRIERMLDACDRLAAGLPEPDPRGIHRDFYPDQVLVDGSRLYLVDFDLFCEGDPALDIGNFSGHLIEQSLRTSGDPYALACTDTALRERFAELAGDAVQAAVEAYTTLTLVRHIHLSTRFVERHPFTESLLEVCEARLGIARHSRAGHRTPSGRVPYRRS